MPRAARRVRAGRGGGGSRGSLSAPRVPDPSAARVFAWLGLALAVWFGGRVPRDSGGFGPVLDGDQCRLGTPGTAPACACDALDARTRLALGLPVALDALAAADLELLDGIGPARALAIEAERARGGAFGSSQALAARVAGIGPATATRVATQLAGRDAARCESTGPARLR
jgi:hypothetical protein